MATRTIHPARRGEDAAPQDEATRWFESNPMALIGRLIVIFFGFLAACLVAGMIVVGAVLFPEFSDLGAGPVDSGALNILLGFGFIFVSGFALLPAMIVVLITEAFYVRGALTYAVGGGLVGLACYLGLVPFDPTTLPFERIVRRP